MKRPFRPYCNNLVSPMQLFPNVPYEIDNYHFERWCIFVILKFHNRCHHDFNDEANFVDRFYNIYLYHTKPSIPDILQKKLSINHRKNLSSGSSRLNLFYRELSVRFYVTIKPHYCLRPYTKRQRETRSTIRRKPSLLSSRDWYINMSELPP